MLVLIMCHPDGDSYRLSNDLDVLKAKFDYEKENGRLGDDFTRLVLADVEPDTDFGFGAWGDFYGGDVIEEFEGNDDE
jgi:hypothetical protein